MKTPTYLADFGRWAHLLTSAWCLQLSDRLEQKDERGEGVISMAIAVLIVAFLGAAAWLAFKGLLDGTKEKAEIQIARVGG